MTLAEKIVCILHQNTTKDCAQITDEGGQRVGREIVLARHMAIHVIRGEAEDRPVAPENHEDGQGNQNCNG